MDAVSEVAVKAVVEGSWRIAAQQRAEALTDGHLEKYELLDAQVGPAVAEALEALCRESLRRAAVANAGGTLLAPLNAVDFVASHLMQNNKTGSRGIGAM